MKITYWSDYVCPYCYIGEVRLKKVLSSAPELRDVEVEMKSFQLDPTAGEHAAGDTQTRFAKKYRISFEAAGQQIETISQMGRDEGIDFRYATTLFTNTMDAHRLTKLAQSKGDAKLTERVIEALFDAYFTQNRELADHALLQKIGEDCGLDADEVREVLSSDRYEAEVLADEREAASRGIYGVPFFLINGRYTVSGAPSAEGLRQALLKLAVQEQTEVASGVQCGPDGCRIR